MKKLIYTGGIIDPF